MSIPVITINQISKHYLIGSLEPYNTLREVLSNPFKKKPRKKLFKALESVTLEIQPGDVVGLIGKNGSGKSTLLKILSRITPPTTGTISIVGRVASLLEVGTGFNPELTGRENVFLNGSILGMKQKEIRSKFDEIVDFSGVETFLDTPVKRYSSGMYVRLAFAVAAHLESEILLVDEVLAVGDVEFQKKCLGKVSQLAGSGRTVIFVSHNMQSIEHLCNRIVLLEKGKVKFDGYDVAEGISRYLHSGDSKKISAWWDINSNDTTEYTICTPKAFGIVNENLEPFPVSLVNKEDHALLMVKLTLAKLPRDLLIGYRMIGDDGSLIFYSLNTDAHPDSWPKLSIGENVLITKLPLHLLKQGKYKLELMAKIRGREWLINPEITPATVQFEIGNFSGQSAYFDNTRKGIITPIIEWKAVQ